MHPANGTSGPVSCSFEYPRIPVDARALRAQVVAILRNALRDNRFVLATVRDSESVGSWFDSKAAHQLREARVARG